MNSNLKIKILILILVLVTAFVSTFVYFKTQSRGVQNVGDNLQTFTSEQLSKYNGTDSTLPIYIGLNGYVYDVSTGVDFYPKGKSYNYLTGRDSSTELNYIGGKIIEKKYPIIGKIIK